jgi:nucleoside-diphosphate-sugar epimerase
MASTIEVGPDAHEEVRSLFITGGTGFFGRSILRRIAAVAQTTGYGPPKVTVLTRSPASFLERYPEFARLSWLTFHAGDILSGLSAFPKDGKFTHVLHAAADSTLGPRMASLDRFDQIVTGTRNVLDFAVSIGASRFLLTSSGGVYGAQPATLERIPESYLGMPDPLSPDNAYSVSKRQAEHLCALYGEKHGLVTVVARCFAFVGPDLPLDAHFAIGNFIRDALDRPEITVNGNGTPLRSYLYQDDLADWLLTLLEKGQPAQAYNVGSDEAISIAELAHLVRDLIAPGKTVRLRGIAGADTAVRNRYVPDICKARSELGLQVTTPLADAIRLTARGVASGAGESTRNA